ncbi:type VI secretion protein [Pragia fontium]|uniref:Type VI secretion protein n=1 Tax=Pragia fontium TaxID=82985 RepID=A0ABQ5LHS7_9GAMM|nr:type VI secretion system baseplate subunit TssF [Pragia fontium]GKX63151.1 type VI secretion protein [Pragia fontium]
MLSDSYIKQENHYLNEESKKFVEEFPQISQFLAEPYFDPDVNRTLDGFTYLSSLLHAKINQEYPQLTSNLMDMLWPNYLQLTPSITIMEFNHQDHEGVQILSQATVLSPVTASQPVSCTFRTTRDIWVTPFVINQTAKTSTNTLRLNFTSHNSQNLAAAGIDKLSLFLGADMMTSFQLYLYFAEYLSAATLHINGQSLPLPDLQLVATGFNAEDAILDYPINTYAGYRLLHEYFSFTEGFLFFTLKGLPDYLDRLSSETFALEFEFKQPLPPALKLTTDSIKVNCVPAINLFYHDCEPITLSGEKTEYPLYINHQQRQHYELFSIDSITGWANNQTRKYTAFDSFQHQINYENGGNPLYYHLNRKPSVEKEHIDYSLSFVRGDEAERRNDDEIISIRALCSNRDEAQKLRIGEINLAGEGIPATVTFKNITFPSGITRPNLDGSLQWSTISSLSLNYLSLLNKDSLCQILQNYNFTARYNQRSEKSLTKLLSCIQSFESVPHQQYFNDLIIEGHKSTLVISPDAFNNTGEMYLFGSIMAHFYSQYATVNSFHVLELVNSSTHEVYQWSLMNT